MDENRQAVELLERMERNSRRQTLLTLMQCVFSLAAAVFCGAVLVLFWQMLPQLESLLPQLQSLLTELETAAQQLARIDLTGMVADVEVLVTTAQQSLTETMGKLDTIDFQTLNKAIDDLAAVVEPEKTGHCSVDNAPKICYNKREITKIGGCFHETQHQAHGPGGLCVPVHLRLLADVRQPGSQDPDRNLRHR